jgi:hypothetical protein
MKNIRDVCTSFLQDENIRKDIKEIIKPLIQIMYNEIYIYLWLLWLYNVFLFCIILVILVILVRLFQNSNRRFYVSSM